jgi:hypothetical protein
MGNNKEIELTDNLYPIAVGLKAFSQLLYTFVILYLSAAGLTYRV